LIACLTKACKTGDPKNSDEVEQKIEDIDGFDYTQVDAELGDPPKWRETEVDFGYAR